MYKSNDPNKTILESLIPDDDLTILKENFIYSAGRESFMFVGNKRKALDYLNKITFIDPNEYNAEKESDEIVKLEVHTRVITDMYYSTPRAPMLRYYVDIIPVEKNKEDMFNYSKEALDCCKLPIALEYKIKGNPLLDWAEEITKEVLFKEE